MYILVEQNDTSNNGCTTYVSVCKDKNIARQCMIDDLIESIQYYGFISDKLIKEIERKGLGGFEWNDVISGQEHSITIEKDHATAAFFNHQDVFAIQIKEIKMKGDFTNLVTI